MSPRPKAEVPLIRKIAQAFAAVGKLQRRGRNTSGSKPYPFTYASDVLEAVRMEFLKRDVLIHIDEGTPEYVPITETNGGGQMTECRLPVTYTFMDEKGELKPMRFNGAGRDVAGKELYKAQTGAQKALLKRFGLMAEETDDPEWDGNDDAQPSSETLDDVAPRRVPRREQLIREFEIKAIVEGCAQTGKSTAEISQAMCTRFKVDEMSKLKRWQFKDALAWATNGAGTISPKPQAAPALQASLPLPKPAPSFEMRVGGKTETVQPKTGSYAL